MEKSILLLTHPIPRKHLVFFIMVFLTGASVLLSLNQVVSDTPLIIEETPANASTFVSVYLTEVSFTIAGDDVVHYDVMTSPEFIGGAKRGVATPGETIHILRREQLLAAETTYVWWVNVTNGQTWENSTFYFSTGRDIFPGYTLFSPLNPQNTSTFLIDSSGVIVHRWPTSFLPCFGAYLVENGSILRPYTKSMPEMWRGVQKIAWDGTVLWDYLFSGEMYWQTHDVAPLPNGNILILALERKTAAEALAAGRNASLLLDGEIWPMFIVEVHPTGLTSGEIVWEWHLWDHLIQDYDPTKMNYGRVGDHPELLDVNFVLNGYKDWIHPNTLHYHPELDQIILCSRHIGEFWIIDHSTTTQEARSHTGGVHGKGGDFLYRWGNPQAYRAGDASDQRLFGPHDSQWIAPGCPGAGDILIFNNGWGRPEGNYSTIEQITPPIDVYGEYHRGPGTAYGPVEVTWRYQAPDLFSFYASFISGCERLPNGNTLICNGPIGRFFEVTKNGTLVWSYNNNIPFPGALVFRAHRYYSPFSPPIPPVITGPQTIAVGVPNNYTVVSVDPEGDLVLYSIDWGDGTTDSWVGPYPSGEAITVTHIWETEGYFHITCVAKDRFESVSGSSGWNLSVGIPYPPSNPSPALGATDVDVFVNMSWIGGDPDPADQITFDVYFGSTNPPPKVVENQTSEYFHPGVLEYGRTYYWRIVSWDAQGMSATGPLWCFTTVVDAAAPLTTLHLNGTMGNEGWFVTPVMMSFEAVDTQSGVNATWYKLDDAPWEMYSSPVLVSSEGRHVTAYYSVDVMGNKEQTMISFLRIDTTAPWATLTVAGVLGNQSWYLSNVTITLTAGDNESGVFGIWYRLDTGDWTEYIMPFIIPTDGVHTLLYYAVDRAGNTQQLQTPFDFQIDRTPPLINLTVIPQNLLRTRWLFTAMVSDETSGVNKVDFYIDEMYLGTMVAPGPYDWVYEGEGDVVYAVAFDEAGNQQTSPHVNQRVLRFSPRSREGNLPSMSSFILK